MRGELLQALRRLREKRMFIDYTTSYGFVKRVLLPFFRKCYGPFGSRTYTGGKPCKAVRSLVMVNANPVIDCRTLRQQSLRKTSDQLKSTILRRPFEFWYMSNKEIVRYE